MALGSIGIVVVETNRMNLTRLYTAYQQATKVKLVLLVWLMGAIPGTCLWPSQACLAQANTAFSGLPRQSPFLLASLQGQSVNVLANKVPSQQAKIPKGMGAIFGQVTFVQGNMMPSPDGPKSGGQPVRRQIGVFKLTSFRQTKTGIRTGFFAAMGSRPVLTTWSAKDGNYRLRLKPGTYSVCVREAGQWYANLSDHLGHINPVIVQQDSTIHHDLLINYKAVY
jgi:hypothetical protein